MIELRIVAILYRFRPAAQTFLRVIQNSMTRGEVAYKGFVKYMGQKNEPED